MDQVTSPPCAGQQMRRFRAALVRATRRDAHTASPCGPVCRMLTDIIYLLIGFRESTCHKTVHLMFELVTVNNKFTIL